MSENIKAKIKDKGKMNLFRFEKIKSFIALFFFLISIGAYSQTCDVTLRNDSLINANTIILDIYVTATSGNFYYGQGQFKVSFNSSITNGGTITGSIVNGYSDLTNSLQVPTPTNVILGTTSWRITTEAIPATQAACSQISSSGIGTRICRVQLTNTVAFGVFSADMLLVTTSPNATAVWYSDVDGTVYPTGSTMVNTNLFNPILNGNLTSYNVTGTGLAPSNVGLDGSQAVGVNYLLYNNSLPQGSSIAGTGSPIDFGSQTEGIYTIKAHRIATFMYADMTGNASISPPAPTGSATQAYCSTSSPTVASLNASGTAIQWYSTSTGGTPLSASTALVDGSHYYATQTISGIESATRLDVTVTVSDPAPPTAAAAQSFCSITSPTVASLSATGTAIQWYAASTGGSPLAPGTALINSTHYFATQTISGCESSTRFDVTVTVSDPPAPTGSSTQSFCSINNPTVANLNATGTFIQWYAASTGGSPLAPGIALVNNTHYYASQTVGICESNTRLDVTVSVSDPAPPAGSSTQTFCSINSPTVANLIAIGSSIQWYAASTGGSPLAPGIALVNNTHYYASQTVGICESNTRLDVTVTISDPAPPAGSSTQTFCSINSPTVANLIAIGTSIQWYAASTGGTPLAPGTALVNNTHYYASQTVAGCESNSRFDVTVTIGNPAAPTGSSTQSFCAISNPTVVSLTAVGTTIQWYAASTGGSALAAGTALVNNTHYYASQTVAGCESSSRFDVTVTISDPPAPTGTAAQNFCSINNPTVTDLNATGTSIQWYAASIGGLALASGTALVNNTHYYASQTVAACESSTRFDVTVTISNPAAPTGIAAQSFCSIDNPTIANLSAVGTNIKWYAGSTGGTALLPGTALVNNAHYYASQTVAGCESSSRFDVTVTISNPAAPTGIAAQSFCSIDNPTIANLSAVGTNIKWYAASTGGTALLPGTALVNNAHYYASQTVAGCESSSRFDVTVTISNPAAPTGIAAQSFCSINNPTVTSLIAVGTAIQWYAAPTGGTALPPGTALVNNTHYYASQTVAACESSTRFDVTVTISNPAAPSGTAAQNFCSINSPTVADLNATGTSIQWYAASTGGLALTPGTALVNNTHYYASQTLAGCESNTRLDVTVTISNPAAPTGTAAQNFCSINNPTVADLNATGTSIQWYAASTGGSALAPGTALVNNTHYYASQTVASCESSTRFDVTVTISNPAAPTGIAAQSFCSINNPTVTSLLAVGTAIQWYAAPTGGTTLPPGTALVDNTHYYASQTLSGCESSGRFDVKVSISNPAAPTGSSSQTFCSINNPTVANLTAAGTAIQWYSTFTGGSSLAPGTALVNNTHYYASQTLSGCESSGRLDVTVTVSDPAAPTGAAAQTFCSINSPTIANIIVTGTSILWYNASTGGTLLATSTPLVTGTHYYATQTVGGCESNTRLDVAVTVSNPAAPTGSASQSFCAINSPTIANIIVTGTAIKWYNAATGGTILATSTPLVTGTHYYASQTLGGCESNTRLDVTVTISDPAAPTGIAAQSFCSISSPTVANLTATGSSIKWYSVPTGGVFLATSTALVTGTHYYASQTVAGCESSTRLNVLVTISDPAAPTGPAAQSFCAINLPTVANLSVTGTAIQWYSVVTGGIPLSASTALINNTHYYASQTLAGCESNVRLDVSVTVSNPAAPTGSASQILCAGNNPTIDDLTVTGSAIKWYAASTGGSPLTAGTALVNNTHYYASQTVGSCESVSRFDVTVTISNPSAPVVGTITQPTCAIATGSVVLSGLPSGNWTINPGNIAGSTASTTVSGLATGTYSFTVTNSVGCTSPGSVNAVIDAQPVTPSVPTVGTITQPTCALSTGSVILSGLPSGNWTINPGSLAGSTATTTISLLVTGTYNFTVTNSVGCTSPQTSDVIINSQPVTPAAPTVGTITQPTCAAATGAVILSGLPAGTWTINPGNISGSTASKSVTGLATGTYNFNVKNSAGCISAFSNNVVINAQPVTPSAPTIGTITPPTCISSTGSVILNGLPSSGTWTINPGAITGSGTSKTISNLISGTYVFKVTNSVGCTSPAAPDVVIPTQPGTPSAPIVGTITPPTCTLATGSVVLNNLPATGSWTLTRLPGAVTTSDSGVSITVTGLSSGIYNFTVTNSAGCTSAFSANVNIPTQPASPSSPTESTDCSLGFGNASILVTSPTGAGYQYKLEVGSFQSGTTFTGVVNGSHSITVMNAAGCTTTGTAFNVNCGCVDGPAVSLSSITGSTCGITPVTVGSNTFVNATTVTISEDGAGSVNQSSFTTTPFAFTYTPTAGDAGNIVTITLTTDNPLGGPCTPAIATYTLTVNANPTAPVVGTITQPTCATATGSVLLSGLPATGTWTIIRSPGSVTASGTGTSTTVSGIPTGTYTFTVTNSVGCISPASGNVVINTQPVTPSAPVVGTITQPTCLLATGSVVLSGLPAGNWTINPGSIAGSGPSTTISGLVTGTYNFTVNNSAGCTSAPSSNVVINIQPGTPSAPVIGTITQPTCAVATGSVILSGLPGTGTWTINPGNINGTGTSTTISALIPGTYNFTVTNAAGCISVSSSDAVINNQPATPSAPLVGTITPPTCILSTGSVVLNGLPSTGTWTINPGNKNGSGSSTSISGLSSGTYNFTVTNSLGCTSVASANVVIPSQPGTPTAPDLGSITQPSCGISTGSIQLNGLPGSGTWTLTRYPGTITTTGTGTSTIVSNLPTGTYNYTVSNSGGCVSVASSNIVINAQPVTPSAPAVGTITQPTCVLSTGSVILTGLPAGNWTINPGGISGSSSSTTISALSAGTYAYTVTNSVSCTSLPSSDVIINAQPVTPSAPIIGTITQPTCALSTGSVVLSGLPSGNWTINPGNIAGSSASTTISGLTTGSHAFTVTNSVGCTSVASANVVINSQPVTPSAPTIGTITQPSCALATGSVILTGLPSGNWTINPGNISGSTSSKTLSGLSEGTYSYTVTNSVGCPSASSANVVINAQPPTPSVSNQAIAIVTGGTFTVTPSGVPVGTMYTWTAPSYVGGVSGGSAQSTPQPNISGTLIIPSGAGSATYTVTPITGACIGSTFTVTVTVTSSCVAVDIGTQPSNNKMCATSGTASFTVVPNGTSPFTYLWQYFNGTWTNVTNGTPAGAVYLGATTSTLNISGINSGGTPQYRCFIANCGGGSNVTSNAVTLTINTPPATPTASASLQPTCSVATGTITITAPTGAGITYSIDSISYLNTSGIFSSVPPGSYSVTAKNASGCISSGTNVTINAQPPTVATPTVTLTQPNCNLSTGTITVTSPHGSGLTYSIDGSTYTNTTGIFSSLAAGPYIVTAKNSVGCISNGKSATITAQPATPIAPVVNLTQPNCVISTGKITVTAPTGTGMTYSIDSISYTNSNGIFNAVATGSYSITAKSSAGCVSLKTIVIIDAQPPSPTAPIDSIVQPTCKLSTGKIIISSPTGANMTYSIDDSDYLNTSGVFDTVAQGVYNLTAKNDLGCISPATNVTINAPPGMPTLIITDPTPKCSPGTANLTSSSVTAGSSSGLTFTYWSDSLATISFNTPANSPSGKYYIKGTTSSGCFDIEPVTVDIVETPHSNAGPNGFSCDKSYSLNATPSIGIGTWTKKSGPDSVSFSPDANSPNATVTVSSYGTYEFMWTETNGICSDESTIEIIFDEKPIATAGPDENICGQTSSLNAAPSIGNGYWSKFSGPGSISFSPDSGSNQPNVSVTVFGSYLFAWNVINGNCFSTDTVKINYFDLPKANAGVDTEVCSNYVKLNAQLSAGTGVWSKVSGSGNIVFSPDSFQYDASASVDIYDTYLIKWVETNSICSSSDTIRLTFRSLPFVQVNGDTAICQGNSVQLNALGEGTFHWFPDSLVDDSSIANPLATPVVSSKFYITLKDQFGCTSTDSIIISVVKPPAADAGRDTILDYVFETTLNAKLDTNEVGVWSLTSGTGNFNDVTDPHTLIDNLGLNTNILNWIVSNGVCPADTAEITITVHNLIIPTLITPNMDGKNDYFILRGIETLGQTQLIILDRWGHQLYKNDNYNNDWNGIDSNGAQLPDDTYFYLIKGKNGISLSGYIVIRR